MIFVFDLKRCRLRWNVSQLPASFNGLDVWDINEFVKLLVQNLVSLIECECCETVVLVIQRDTAAGGIKPDSWFEPWPKQYL